MSQPLETYLDTALRIRDDETVEKLLSVITDEHLIRHVFDQALVNHNVPIIRSTLLTRKLSNIDTQVPSTLIEGLVEYPDTLPLLLEQSIFVDQIYEWACNYGDDLLAQFMVDGGYVDKPDLRTLVDQAIENDDHKKLQELIQAHDIDVNEPMSVVQGAYTITYSPIIVEVCTDGATDCVRTLIELDFPLDKPNWGPDNKYLTPAERCYEHGHNFCGELIEDHLERKYIEREEDLMEEFMFALDRGQTEVAKSCIDRGLNPNYRTYSPIDRALSHYHPEVLRYLVNKGGIFREKPRYPESKEMAFYLFDVGLLDLHDVPMELWDGKRHMYYQQCNLIKENFARCMEQIRNRSEKSHYKMTVTIEGDFHKVQKVVDRLYDLGYN